MDKNPPATPLARYTFSEMAWEHGAAVGKIHAEHLRHSFMSYLGARFLGRLYEVLIELEYGFGFVVLVDDKVAGFSFGRSQPTQAPTRYVFKAAKRLAIHVIVLIFTHPISLAKAVTGVMQSGKIIHDPDVGELLAIAVLPEARRGGNGAKILEMLFERMRQDGCARARWAAHGGNAGMKQFSKSVGAVIISETRIMGRPIVWYERDLRAGPTRAFTNNSE
jgi:GNAT superfamily N-acetyltransferase